MSIPTQEDAFLMVELFKVRMEPFMQESETWFSTQFQPESWEEIKLRHPVGTKEWRMLTTVLGYWELLGSLLDHNLLSEDLLFDAIESVDVTWDKVQAWLPNARLEMGSDLWENIELLVARQRRWKIVRVPKAQQV